MAKFSSDFTTAQPGNFQVFSGVRGPVLDLGAIAGMGTGINNYMKNQAAAAEAEQKKKDATAVGVAAIEALDLEGEQAQVNQMLADMRQEVSDLANAESDADKARLAVVTRELNQLQAAEAAGANPNSIKARQRAMLKKHLVDNPHLADKILTQFGKVDALQAADSDMSADPTKAAINEMIAGQAKGIPISQQVQLAQAKQRQAMAEAELGAKEAAGNLAMTDLLSHAHESSTGLAVDVEANIGALVAQSEMLDDQGNPIGFNADTAKTTIMRQIEDAVAAEKSKYFAAARRTGMVLTAAQIESLDKTIRGNIESSYTPYLEAMDDKNALQRIKDIQQARLDIAKNTSVETWTRANPVLAEVRAVMGNEAAFKIGVGMSRAQFILADDKRGGEAVLDRLAQADPEGLGLAVQIMRNEGIFAYSAQRLANPGASTGLPALDAMADAGNIEELKDNTLNMGAQSNVVTNAMLGTSFRNVRELMSDAYYNRLKTDEEGQKALRNVNANEAERLWGNFESMEMINNEGVNITFARVDPRRVKNGNRYQPAQAFTATMADGSAISVDVQKQVLKLNTMYTLMGAFSSADELQAWGESMGKYVDRNSPEFVKRHSDIRISQLQEKRMQTEKFFQSRIDAGSPNIYDRDPNYAGDQSAQMSTELAAIDMQIQAQRMRNPDNPLSRLPAGSKIDEAESARAGRTVFVLPDGRKVMEGQ